MEKNNENGLMIPPEPMKLEDMIKVSGGTGDVQPGPEMKVVELKDGGFASVPSNAIFDTADDASRAADLLKPPMPHHHHCNGKDCHHNHGHHGHGFGLKMNPNDLPMPGMNKEETEQ